MTDISPTMFSAANGPSRARSLGIGPRTKNVDRWTSESMWAVVNSPVEVHWGAGGLSYAALRRLCRTPQVAAIIRTRQNQGSEFTKEQIDPFAAGWKLSPEDPKKKVTAKMRSDMDYVRALVKSAGGPWFQGGLEGFVRAIIRDTLMYDKVNFEIVPDPYSGLPVAFIPVDPETIRRCEPSKEDKDKERWDFAGYSYSQWIDGDEKARFTHSQMAWGTRNPRTELGVVGYGHPEMEELIFIVSSIINSMASNAANYMTGINGNAIGVFKTRMGKERFQQVERMVHAALSGPRQNRKTPFIQVDPTIGEEIDFKTLNNPSNDDMQYTDWINFLLKTICAVYCIDPAEMGYVFGNEGTKNQQYANSPLDRIINSKERGLRPLMRAIASWINYWVIQPYWPDLRFDFVGFDAQSAKDRDESDFKAVERWKTANDCRIERNYEPLDHPAADLPLHANFQVEDSAQAPPVVEFDSAGAWLNGRRARKPAFQEAA